MRLVKLFLRIVRYAIYAALAFVIAALAVLTLTERGRDNLAGLISDFASSPGRTVKISGINGIWSGNLTLQGLVLEDEDGPWLVARNIAVDWSPLSAVLRDLPGRPHLRRADRGRADAQSRRTCRRRRQVPSRCRSRST